MRDPNLKIQDIKVVRSVTRLLGKLGINFCRHRQPPPPHPYNYSDKYKEFTYGWGLTESKSYVEMKYNYSYAYNCQLTQFQARNYIREVQRTRQFINILHRLGIKSADQQGLLLTKEFVARMRQRN